MKKDLTVFWILVFGAFVTLGAAAVWMGGLNQDEGWYLYAANLVAEGKVPYRDFFFTQGPVMPFVYSAFAGVWSAAGVLGARLLTLAIGFAGLVFAVALARRMVTEEKRGLAGLVTFLLLGCNLYHLYYLAIPKTYALAGLFVLAGFYLLSVAVARAGWLALLSGLSFALAAGSRISLGAILAVVGLWLLTSGRWKPLVFFCLGGFLGLGLVYLPFVCDAASREGLLAAQKYHAARGGFDVVWVVGSLSRLVRWYLPVFVVLGLGTLVPGVWCLMPGARKEVSEPATKHQTLSTNILLWGFLAVFVVQMLAPFPYEDYQVPIMGLLAVYAAVSFTSSLVPHPTSLLLVLGLCFANSFGSPLLEKWATNGQDRFWSVKKGKTELAQLRDVARRIERLDPGGKMLLTQDLYLAIETGRKVPAGLEMGPFAILSDAEWRELLLMTAPDRCPVAALSGYTFAVNPPVCDERPMDQQMEYWSLLKRHYELVDREEFFGQNATTLLVLERKD